MDFGFGIVLDVIGWGFVGLGSVLMLVSAIGVLRMPDFFSRIHPAGVADAFAAPLIFVGVMFLNGFDLFSWKLVILIIFVMITSPTASHALAKAALLSGSKPLEGEQQ